MSSFCTAKAPHIFSAKKFSIFAYIVSLDVNFNESLTNDIVSFEQLGPDCKNCLYGDRIYLTDYPPSFFFV